MEICERGQFFVEAGDDCIFDHTKLIFRGYNDKYFYAKSNERRFPSSSVDINNLEIVEIPEDIWPLAKDEFTRAPSPLLLTYYLKRPSLLYYDDTPNAPDYKRLVLSEVEACEVLRTHPHPNIVPYFGCVVRNGRIRGLCFAKYSVTLSQMLKDGTPFDKSCCLRGIEAGIRHMHGLGLVHNDLNPSNIMMDGNHPVIIDFDSCTREGKKLGSKGGSDGWMLEGQDYARSENDLYSISKIREALMGEN